jgi:hypothetical protein
MKTLHAWLRYFNDLHRPYGTWAAAWRATLQTWWLWREERKWEMIGILKVKCDGGFPCPDRAPWEWCKPKKREPWGVSLVIGGTLNHAFPMVAVHPYSACRGKDYQPMIGDLCLGHYPTWRAAWAKLIETLNKKPIKEWEKLRWE